MDMNERQWKKRKQKPVMDLAAKHAARIQATRTIRNLLGNGLAGSLAATLARYAINKTHLK